jgi:hypothetical protein
VIFVVGRELAQKATLDSGEEEKKDNILFQILHLEEGKKKDNILFQILHLEEGKKKIAE